MKHIRPFAQDDIPRVARLWYKVFRRIEHNPGDEFLRYFERVFFQNPERDAELSSLVHTAPDGRIIGFLGVIPRGMEFRGNPLRVAVSTQLMVDHDARDPLAAFRLTKTLLDGPQDLTYTDGANDVSARLFSRAGGDVVLLKSMDWARILRHTRFFADIIRDRPVLGWASALGRPLCDLADLASMALPYGPSRLPASDLVQEQATPESLLHCLEVFTRRQALRPLYRKEVLEWALGIASKKRAAGDLQSIILKNRKSEIVGWYLYYLKKSGTSQVLQIGGAPEAAGSIIDHLFQHARMHGSLAIRGQLEPDWLLEMSDRFCRFRCLSLGILAHARDQELRLAIHRGDAFLSRLEGEWWLQFDPDKTN